MVEGGATFVVTVQIALYTLLRVVTGRQASRLYSQRGASSSFMKDLLLFVRVSGMT